MKKWMSVLLLLVTVACGLQPVQTGGDGGQTLSEMAVLAAVGKSTNPNNPGPIVDGSSPAALSVLSSTPTADSVVLTSSTTVQLTFNEAADHASVESSFSVSDGSVTISGTFAWSNDQQVTWTPSSAMTSWKVHTATLTTGAKTQKGGSLATNFTASFRVGPFFQDANSGSLYWQGGPPPAIETFSNATSICASRGMRLPTSAELQKIWDTNNQNFMYSTQARGDYWTTDPGAGIGYYTIMNDNYWGWAAAVNLVGYPPGSSAATYRCVM